MASGAGHGSSKGGSVQRGEALYDADAPYIVESYQHEGEDAPDSHEQPPSYTYSQKPHTSGGQAPTRSWDDAARAQTNPIRPDTQMPAVSRAYVDVESGLDENGVAGGVPGPLNATISGYATAHGWELGKLCALCYIFPPFTGAFVLVWETQNVRK